MATESLTPYQILARVRDRVGAQINLRPYDEIVNVSIEPSRVAVLIAHHKVEYTSTQERLTARVMHLREWSAVGDELIYREMQLPDPTFEPKFISKFGGGRTVEEWTSRRLWENDCGTPGSYRTGAPIQAEREQEYFG